VDGNTAIVECLGNVSQVCEYPTMHCSENQGLCAGKLAFCCWM